jgi:hypothetical protein
MGLAFTRSDYFFQLYDIPFSFCISFEGLLQAAFSRAHLRREALGIVSLGAFDRPPTTTTIKPKLPHLHLIMHLVILSMHRRPATIRKTRLCLSPTVLSRSHPLPSTHDAKPTTTSFKHAPLSPFPATTDPYFRTNRPSISLFPIVTTASRSVMFRSWRARRLKAHCLKESRPPVHGVASRPRSRYRSNVLLGIGSLGVERANWRWWQVVQRVFGGRCTVTSVLLAHHVLLRGCMCADVCFSSEASGVLHM